VNWILLVYRVPIQPTRHRVAVWRSLRRVGAVPLQQSIAALPDSERNLEALQQVARTVEDAAGEFFLLRAESIGASTTGRLERTYTDLVEAEYQELLAECQKFLAEIDNEIRIKKFTDAELAEEEQSFERLERWAAALAAKDVFGAASHPIADQKLDDCASALEGYASRVFAANAEP
jgi:ChrB-like protein